MAVNRRWNIDHLKESLVAGLENDLVDDNARVRDSARKIVMQMEKQNQEDEHKYIDISIQARDLELAELAADLEIEVSAIEDAQGESGVSDLRTEEIEFEAE